MLPNVTQSAVAAAASHPVAAPAASASDYAKAFRAATNYRDFILSALPAAQKGDRDAEYYLSAALAYCDETDRFFFRRRDKILSVEEAIRERAAQSGGSMTEGIRRAYGRCLLVYDQRDPRWGTAEGWLAKAAEDGQPIAQIRTAEKMFAQYVRAGSDPKAARTVTEARSLAHAALETRDPEVLFQVGGLVDLLEPDLPPDNAFQEVLTWQYTACLRGLDCSASAEWLLQFCMSGSPCLPGESGIDYLRRSAQTSLIDLEQRAGELNAKLDAEAWDELGLAN